MAGIHILDSLAVVWSGQTIYGLPDNLVAYLPLIRPQAHLSILDTLDTSSTPRTSQYRPHLPSNPRVSWVLSLLWITRTLRSSWRTSDSTNTVHLGLAVHPAVLHPNNLILIRQQPRRTPVIAGEHQHE